MSSLFSAVWFEAGIVTLESAADFARYALLRPTQPARHWRWAAFRDWSEEREELNAAECRAAFALGDTEPDQNLGTAMMCHVLYQRWCPADVYESARSSIREAVRRVATLRRT
jgi:hypothetical protein